MNNNNIQINLNSVEDILQFISIAEKCDFGVYISDHDNSIVSGKSLLGLCTVIGHGNLDVLYNGNNEDFSILLDKLRLCY